MSIDIPEPYDTPEPCPPRNEAWAARRELAEAMRQMTETLVTTTSDAATLRAVAASLRRQNEILRQSPGLFGRRAFELADAGTGRLGDWRSLSYELNPLDGRCNPLAPPMTTWIEDGIGHGRATLGWAYEGPPGAVHGGHVCALFDHFLGITQILTGQPGVTGALDVRFHLPTPLNTELVLTGRIKAVRGRNNLLSGELRANGVVTASCQGIFVHVGENGFSHEHAPD